MQRVGAVYRWVSIAALVLIFIPPVRAADVDIGSIVRNPEQFDGKNVTIQGTASVVKETVSRKGNPYTTFQVQDETGTIKVFTPNHPGTKNSDRVEVTGVFQKVKRVGQYTFYNEIEAQSVGPTARR